ncbi:MAG: DNA translocase FtsK 4TM domain-containing protein [Candidatus Magnetoovum sp. WYHC-5]|nr:DNA translocase FtsK 4TM domain-containing protein [Candidatus Magnetoovum sp. WYHC-5]
MDKMRNFKNNICGFVSICGAVFVAICLVTYNKWDPSPFTYTDVVPKNYGGLLGSYVADLLLSLMGSSSYLLPIIFFFHGVRRLFRFDKKKENLFGSLMLFFSASFIIAMCTSILEIPFVTGGLAGSAFTYLSTSKLSILGGFVLSLALFYTSVILVLPLNITTARVEGIRQKVEKDTLFEDVLPIETIKREKPTNVNIVKAADKKDTSIFDVDNVDTPDLIEENEEDKDEAEEKEALEDETNSPDDDINNSSAQEHDIFETDEPYIKDIVNEGKKPEFRVGQYLMPPVNLLNKNTAGRQNITDEELQRSAQILNKKLSDFNVDGKIAQVHPGPIISMYEFEPAPGVKISKVVSLSDDLGRAMGGLKVRVTLIPGKTTIGIEVPNEKREIVTLGEIITSDTFKKRNSLLTLSLGKDIYGTPVAEDLTRMPHLLVAGTTGSGKSVAINSMIISILYKAKPSEVKMLMVDPKLLELSIYEGIPHLLTGVITNPKEASEALKKMLLEMERRYRLIADQGVRNIEMYNASVSDDEKLPYIVIIIDELADLMFTSSKSVEESIVRLAQMARASGIHLILATQRPSVDVITGIIKANFPSRIAFQVTSKVDSRTILDTHGAEKLLGRGDMLLLSAGAKILRVHGAYVSDNEVTTITNYVKAQGTPDYSLFDSLTTIGEASSEEQQSDKDELFTEVVNYARSIGEVSISSIQRRFKIGYNRAARIMDMLEEHGLVGPSKGAGKARDFVQN